MTAFLSVPTPVWVLTGVLIVVGVAMAIAADGKPKPCRAPDCSETFTTRSARVHHEQTCHVD